MSKALDIYILEKPTGGYSRARSYVVHNTDDNKEPILIFHSLETEMIAIGDSIWLSISPHNNPKRYVYIIQFEDPAVAKELVHAYKLLKQYGCDDNLLDLEALHKNTYPSDPTTTCVRRIPV